MKRVILLTIVLFTFLALYAKEYHVAKSGNDKNPGTKRLPFLTIQAAANIAQPGNTITVHEGIYRERINPPRGGTSDAQRITYQAAPGEKVVITGSEVVTGWERVTNDTWMVTLANSFFGDFNPYSDVLDGHWFRPRDRIHHTGSVYLNGVWRGEAATLEEVLKPAGADPLWFGQVTNETTTIWAQFPNTDPNREKTEINARQTVFFPEQTGINYITVRGFTLRHAATPWAAPTQKQMGLIGPHWSKGWIIEDNTISHAITVGVQLGTTYLGEYPGNVHGNNAIMRDASESGAWSRETVGSHIVRRNRISHCEAAGINGNMGAAFSLLENNFISDIHVRRTFGGLEQGGIKLHGSINTIIRGNTVCRTGGEARAIWVDWLAQGTVIEGNIGFDNENTDLYVEVTHGPTLVANNIFLSRRSIVSTSRGTAYVNNYFAGSALIAKTTRNTPYAVPHSTSLIGGAPNDPGDDRYFHNIFAGSGPAFLPGWGGMDQDQLDRVPFDMEGNLYLNGAVPPAFDKNPIVMADVKPPFRLVRADGTVKWIVDEAWRSTQIRPVATSERLGKTKVTNLPYEMPDGSPVRIDRDILGNRRNAENTLPGPVEKPGAGFIDPALCGAQAPAPDRTAGYESAEGAKPMNFQQLAEYNVTWGQLGRNSADSMPLGNGDVGLNVWTEGNGDMVFYIGKNDAWSEDTKSPFSGAKGLLKLGRVRVSLSPNPFINTPKFSQTLVLEDGSILLKSQAASGESHMRIWVDANHPVIHVNVKCANPVKFRVALESWRQEKTEHLGVDTILDNQTNRIAWFYRNANREIPAYVDRTFGGVIEGEGLVSLNSNTLESQASKTHHVSIHTLTAQSPTSREWLSALDSQIEKTNSLSYDQAWKEHVAWWEQFWNRSWIFVSGNEDAIIATRGYILQRFKNACSSRGEFPVKFNGSIFNVDNPEFRVNVRSVDTFPVDADFRKWGYQYWFQNTRCIYWPMLASGDFDLMKPLFRMYRDMIERNAGQIRSYYGHGGAYIQETSPSWGGLKKIDENTPEGHTGRYYQAILELSAMMIDYYSFTQDKEFVIETLLPVADAGVTFYAEHFPRSTEGELRIEPANSLETYWNVTNPMPDIAGLRWVLSGLLALPPDLTAAASRQRWQKYLDELPWLPVGTRHGKETLLPFETFTEGYKRNNGENPELYAVHPYRFYGMGKPDIRIARAAFEFRTVKRSGCWSQDGVKAAYLGDIKTARENLIFNFSRREPRLKFPAFWQQGFDYTPDEDNGGNAVHMLQLMLMQSDAGVIRLLPAWPKEWDADFKLNAPGRTSVEGRVRRGTLQDLRVTPESRRTDIILIGEADPESCAPTAVVCF